MPVRRFGSAGNLNVYFRWLVVGGVYQCGVDGVPVFGRVGAPASDELHALVQAIVTRLMGLFTLHGLLVEGVSLTCLAEPDADGCEAHTLRPL